MNDELDELLNRLMQYSYDYGSRKIPTSENPPLIIARQTKQAITSLIKELVAEAKPELPALFAGLEDFSVVMYKKGTDEFEQNLLKALEAEL